MLIYIAFFFEEELQSENNSLKDENCLLKAELQSAQQEHEKTTDKLRAELRKVNDLFSNLRELFSIERMCRFVGLSEDLTRRILTGDKVGFQRQSVLRRMQTQVFY